MTGASDLRPPRRATVLFGTWFDGWDMPPYHGEMERPWINGGVRALIELAAGLASTGVPVDLRGHFLDAEVDRIERATGVTIGRPSDRRAPAADELVVVPEGHRDPMLFARAALTPARVALFIQAPLGQFGWSFDGGVSPSEEDLLEFDVTSVGRPEQLRAARAFGLELWTNATGIADQARAAGVPMHYVGSGRPFPYPEPGEKDLDAIILGDNRWSSLARRVAEQLADEVNAGLLPRVSHGELLGAFSRARIFIHPSRIEGRSRLVEEARAMRAVPIVLATNIHGEGYGEQYGSVVVETLEEMAPAVTALLADSERWQALSDAGFRWAREIGDMTAFQQRLTGVLAAPDAEVRAGAGGRGQLGAAFSGWVGGVGAEIAAAGQRIAAAQSQLIEAAEEIRRDRARLEADQRALSSD